MLIAVELSKPPIEVAAPHVAGSNVQADFADDSYNKKALKMTNYVGKTLMSR